jgi:hypothetical protein
MTGGSPAPGLPFSRLPSWVERNRPTCVARALAILVFVETFVFLARGDRWETLFFVTKETWFYVAILWGKNLGLAALAALATSRLVRALARTGPEDPGREPLSMRREAAAVAVLLLAGVFLRGVAPDLIPPGTWVDTLLETETAMRAPDRIALWGVVPFDPRDGSRELTSSLWITYSVGVTRLLGRTVLGFLWVSALPGSLALLALWWLAREVAGPRAAILALLLGAFCRTPLILSRWSSIVIGLVFLSTLGAAAALAARRMGSVALGALAGACAGLCLHTHASAPLVVAAFGAFAVSVRGERAVRRPVVAGAIAAGLTALPFLIGGLSERARWGGHVRDMDVFSSVRLVTMPFQHGPFAVPVRLASNAFDYLGVVLFTHDPTPRNALPHTAAFSPLVGAAILLGLGAWLASAHKRPAGERLCLLLAAAGLLAGILAEATLAPRVSRACAALSPALVAGGWALERGLSRAAARGFGRAALLVCLLGAVVLASETVPFLAAWPFDPSVAASFGAAASDAGRRVRILGSAGFVRDPPLDFGPKRSFLVAEVLASPSDAATPLPDVPAEEAGALLSRGARASFWYLTSPAGLRALSVGGWKTARGVAVSDGRPDIVLARVVPRG